MNDRRRDQRGRRAPGHRNWGKLVLPMIDNSIAAVQAVGARIVLPGAIYNDGRDAFPALAEDAPQNPATRKGRIRVELERRLEAASRAGASTLIVRFGDFLGPAPGQQLVQPAAGRAGPAAVRDHLPGPEGRRRR